MVPFPYLPVLSLKLSSFQASLHNHEGEELTPGLTLVLLKEMKL